MFNGRLTVTVVTTSVTTFLIGSGNLAADVNMYVVSKYDYIIMRSETNWKPARLPLSAHLPILSPPVTAKQRVVIIPGDQPEEVIDGYQKKDFEKGVLKWEWNGRRHKKGQQAVQDQSVRMEKSWVIMKDWTDKEHEE